MKKLSKAFSVIFLICICFAFTIPTFAMNDKTQPLKVGFFQLKGFFEYNSSGIEQGYGVKVLEEISKQTGYEFEYVRLDSWEQGTKYLEEEKIDLRMPVTRPLKANLNRTYTSQSIIDTYHVVMALKNREDLYYKDYEKIGQLKIAVSSLIFYNTRMVSYINKIGVPFEKLIFCDSYGECLDLMVKGEVDAIISNVMDFNEDSMKMLDRFYTDSNIIVSRANCEYIYDINEAISNIKMNNPTFFSELYKEYFPERASSPLTKEEQQVLEKIDGIEFDFADNRGYISDIVDDEVVGILPQIAKSVCEKLGVECYNITDGNPKIKENTARCDGTAIYKPNVKGMTLPIIYAQYNQIFRKENRILDYDTCKVALAENVFYDEKFLCTQFSNKQIIMFPTIEDCMKAVNSGKVDLTIANNYVSNYYLTMYRYNGLTQRMIESGHGLSFFVEGKNGELIASAINKVLMAMTNKNIDEIIIKETSRMPQQEILEGIIFGNTKEFIILIVIALLVLFTVVFLVIISGILNKKNKELQMANAAKSQFLSRVSHDMRTPMNAILSFSKMAEEENKDENTRQYLEDIHMSGEYLLSLINDVLDIQKMEAQSIVLNPEIANMDEVFNGIFQMVRPALLENEIDFAINLDGGDIEIPKYYYLDVLRFKHIFMNLISNSIKFTKKGGKIELTVKIIDKTNDKVNAVFTITDNGIGMSKEFQKNMFKPFAQESNGTTSKYKGTGLGLSIVKKIVEIKGGSIICKSKLNEGTKIIINLPMQLVLNNKTDILKIDNDDGILSGKRILLCEDHPMNVKIAQKLLSAKNMEVEVAENGEIGVEKFEISDDNYYDAILMDIRMPIMDGLEASKIIRKSSHQRAKTIPIIAMTANALTEDIERTKNSGMNGHIPKPVDKELLYKLLQQEISREKLNK